MTSSIISGSVAAHNTPAPDQNNEISDSHELPKKPDCKYMVSIKWIKNLLRDHFNYNGSKSTDSFMKEFCVLYGFETPEARYEFPASDTPPLCWKALAKGDDGKRTGEEEVIPPGKVDILEKIATATFLIFGLNRERHTFTRKEDSSSIDLSKYYQ